MKKPCRKCAPRPLFNFIKTLTTILICITNQLTGFYMIGTLVVKEINNPKQPLHARNFFKNQIF